MLSFGHARPPSRRTSSTGGDAGFSASPLPIARSLSPRLPDSMIGTARSLSPRLPDSMIGTAYQDDSTAQLSSTSAIPSVSNAQVDLSIQVPLQQSPLKVEVSKLFCHSLLRDPGDESIRMAVTKVLTIRVIKDEKYKFDEALRFFKSRLTDARTDERRKCLGKHPFPRCKFMATKELAKSIIQSMGGLDDVNDVEAYCQNLALFRKFIRHCSSENQVNHSEYRHWVDSYYSSPDEDEWQELMQEDAAFDYQSLGHGMGIQ
ncbi:hypothetical protein EMCRGX_G018262 [Ephydatia muelleri]